MSAERIHKLWHRRGYLPHFDAGAIVQSLTFRLVDSLPRDVCETFLSSTDKYSERHRRLEAMIDSGRGSCLLADTVNAATVQDALHFFDGIRYRLLAWVVMPNHVHAMLEQLEGYPLGEIVHSWKRFTANRINRRRKTSGVVWAADYFDRYIRNADHYDFAVAYIEHNPVRAGLVAKPKDWPFSSCAVRLRP